MYGMAKQGTVTGTKMITGTKIGPNLLISQHGGTIFLKRNTTTPECSLPLPLLLRSKNHFVLHLHVPNLMLEYNHRLFFDLGRITPISEMVSLGIVTLMGTTWTTSSKSSTLTERFPLFTGKLFSGKGILPSAVCHFRKKMLFTGIGTSNRHLPRGK